MKIALVQANPIIGDFDGNVRRLVEAIGRAAEVGAELAVCSELAVPGYPPRDLLERPEFVDANLRAVDRLAHEISIAAVVGFVDRVDGPTTLYGDISGGLAVISDVPKTMVYELAEEVNRQAARDLIPRSTIDKPPSAELRPDQTDQDSLPPYETLDAILEMYVEEQRSQAEIIAAGHDADTVRAVLGLVWRSEYKRRQAAPGLKIRGKTFGPGRRMPLAARWRGP